MLAAGLKKGKCTVETMVWIPKTHRTAGDQIGQGSMAVVACQEPWKRGCEACSFVKFIEVIAIVSRAGKLTLCSSSNTDLIPFQCSLDLGGFQADSEFGNPLPLLDHTLPTKSLQAFR